MGTLGLISMIEEAGEEKALLWHLQCNCFPGIHPDFYPAIKQAIKLGKKGNFYKALTLPNGKVLTVAEIITQLHLEWFLPQEEE